VSFTFKIFSVNQSIQAQIPQAMKMRRVKKKRREKRRRRRPPKKKIKLLSKKEKQ
jgi:hypothetical protein